MFFQKPHFSLVTPTKKKMIKLIKHKNIYAYIKCPSNSAQINTRLFKHCQITRVYSLYTQQHMMMEQWQAFYSYFVKDKIRSML